MGSELARCLCKERSINWRGWEDGEDAAAALSRGSP